MPVLRAVRSGGAVLGEADCVGCVGRANKQLVALHVGLKHIDPASVDRAKWDSAVGQFLVVVLAVLREAKADLLQIRLAGTAPRVFARPSKDGKEDGREYRYYSYNDQEFNQGKA